MAFLSQLLAAPHLDPEARAEMLALVEKHAGDPAPVIAVNIAESWAHLEVRESDGPNRGPEVDAIHELCEAAGGTGDKEDAAAWCARFVVVCWYLGGLATLQAVDSKVSRSGSVFYLCHSTFKRAPELVTRVDSPKAIAALGDLTRAIRPGDALIRYSMRKGYESVPFEARERSQTELGHTELVLKVHPDGTLDTVGGNTDSQTSRDGNGVFIHRGRYSVHEDRVVAFVRPRFSSLLPVG